jgi:hypothetical protein
MARVSKKGGSGSRGRKTLVRGADGSLYMLSHQDLKPFKLHEKKAKKLDQILKSAKKSPSVSKLPAGLIAQIQSAQGCVSTGAAPDIHINT